MDASSALKSAENAIRDIITHLLIKKFGADWPSHSGITNLRIAGWHAKQTEDEKKLGRSDPRIIYYADFYDLKTLIEKNWQYGLCDVFGKQKELLVLLDILGEFRNPDAHRRELLEHEKHLVIGISARIRINIAEYFSKMETKESYYPRLECVQDSYGNTWTIGEHKIKNTGLSLRVGDLIAFSVSGTDPCNEPLEYAVLPNAVPYKFEWKQFGDFSLALDASHVGNALWIAIAIRSGREHHATCELGLGKVDDVVKFGYEVLPPRFITK